MNRFTKELWDGCPIEEWSHFVELDGNETKVLGEGWAHPVVVGGVIDRLAAYEDSGLSPEEVQKLKKSDASKEQCTIDQHGEIHRLRDELKRYKQAEQEGRLVVLSCKAGDVVWKIKAVFSYFSKPMEDRVERIIIYKNEILVCCTSGAKFSIGSVGKTVFLSREEAEKALEGASHDT